MILKTINISILSRLVLILILFTHCSKAIKQSISASANLHYEMGLGLLKINELNKAEMEFRSAVELDNNFAPAHLGLAVLNYNKQNYAVSELHINKAISIKNHWVDAHLLKGKILYQKEEYQQALKFLNNAEKLLKNGNGNNPNAHRLDIFLLRGLCLKNLDNYEMAGIELKAALKLDPNNQVIQQALDEIRSISKMTANYSTLVGKIVNKKAISRSEWAVILCLSISRKYFADESNKNNEKIKNLPDVDNSNIHSDYIKKAVEWDIVNVYPDEEFKPDLDLSWAEVIISTNNILHPLLKNTKVHQAIKPPFSNLLDWHPLYDGAALATSLGIFKNLSKKSFRLSESVNGIDAMHVIKNLNSIIKSSY